MAKIEKEPRAAVYPAPAALVSAYDKNGKPNACDTDESSSNCMLWKFM